MAYRCAICEKTVVGHYQICTDCGKDWSLDDKPRDEWPGWIIHLANVERNRRDELGDRRSERGRQYTEIVFSDLSDEDLPVLEEIGIAAPSNGRLKNSSVESRLDIDEFVNEEEFVDDDGDFDDEGYEQAVGELKGDGEYRSVRNHLIDDGHYVEAPLDDTELERQWAVENAVYARRRK